MDFNAVVSGQIVASSPRLNHPEQQQRSEQREAASAGMRAWQPVAWKSESTQDPRVERWVPGYACAAGGGIDQGLERQDVLMRKSDQSKQMKKVRGNIS